MRIFSVIIVLMTLHVAESYAADWNSVCGALAKAANEKTLLKNYGLNLGRQIITGVEIDVDNDGVLETYRYHNGGGEIIDEGVTFRGVTYDGDPSVFANPNLIRFEGKHYFVEIERRVLAVMWEIVPNSKDSGHPATPVHCIFDRRWTPKPKQGSDDAICSALLTEDVNRRRFPKFGRSLVAPETVGLQDFVPILQAESLKRYSDVIVTDIDNDGEMENVFAAWLQLGTRGNAELARYVPVVSRPNEIGFPVPIRSFQNLAMMSGIAQARDTVSGISEIVVIEHTDRIYIEDRHIPKEFHGSPNFPFWQVYQLQGDSFSTVCQYDFDWKTIYKVVDGARR